MSDFELDEIDMIVNSLSSPESGYGGYESPERQTAGIYYGDFASTVSPTNLPHLEIVVQPQSSYRFRYLTEFKDNPHGPLTGQNSTKSNKLFPTVKLHNYSRKATIRCWLCVSTNKEPHVHQLLTKNDGRGIRSEPHDFNVDTTNNFTAVFEGLNIIHAVTKKKDYLQCFHEKKCHIKSGYNLIRENYQYDEKALKQEIKKMEKNKAVLFFEAFDAGTKEKIGEIFSNEIRNSKNPNTSTLKIARQSINVGRVNGGTEVMIFVEKVAKDIKVQFYEIDSENQVCWETNAEIDVLWHQVAIAFRTPKYHDLNIQCEKKVNFKIIRESDGTFSNEMEFIYQPEYINKDDYLEPLLPKKRRLDTFVPIGNFPSHNPGDFTEINNEVLGPSKVTEREVSAIAVQDPLYVPPEPSLNYITLEAEPLEVLLYGTNVTDSLDESLYLSNYIDTDGVGASDQEQLSIFTDSSSNQNILASSTEVNKEFNFYLLASTLFRTISENCDPRLFHDALKTIKQNKISPDDLRNIYNKTPLHIAIEKRRLEYVQPLLDAGCNVNAVDIDNNTTLHLGVINETKDYIIKKLLSATAKLDKANNDGDTPLHLACKLKRWSHIKLIMNDSSSTLHSTKTGDTPLHIAVKYGNLDMAEMLLKGGAVVHSSNYESYTPLHSAVQEENADMVRILLKYMNPLEKRNIYLVDIILTIEQNYEIFKLLEEYLEKNQCIEEKQCITNTLSESNLCHNLQKCSLQNE